MWILITILTFKILQQRELKKIINTINIKKATGADNIPAKVVRQCKVTVAQQLSSLVFQKSEPCGLTSMATSQST
jgi:hypothetical protein